MCTGVNGELGGDRVLSHCTGVEGVGWGVGVAVGGSIRAHEHILFVLQAGQ